MRSRKRRKRKRKKDETCLWMCTEDCYHTSFMFKAGVTYRMRAVDLPHDDAGNVRHFKRVERSGSEHGNINRRG